ncbi:TetR/AcrR family transcriptional regulator [Beijerinckia sp. L45]|uniref:TetR/AcrR family transcriptional regulator n=1 Tax=Beijerinckia sp. L45 TaxID=1641855 RepID=UPI00131A6B5A|nr:TetR/AcrR family transcriptional regulator [Beijerinckia sp. L45]
MLRDRVLDAAAIIVERDGAGALSMRKLALDLDCAPMTLYAYFDDKHALLLALAQRSFDALAERLAGHTSHDPLEALRNLYIDYALFGLRNPDDYRTMFMTPEAQSPRERKGPEQMLADNAAFAVGAQRALDCVESGVLTGNTHAMTTLLWTAVHGAIAAILTFPAFPFGDPEAYVNRVVDLTIGALRTQHIEAIA